MFQSILDSGEIELDDITCLVGKNESGKTAILRALYNLNPIRPEDGSFNATDDYPRVEVAEYQHAIANGAAPAKVISAAYELNDSEADEVALAFGTSFLNSRSVVISKYYDNSRQFKLATNEQEAIAFLSQNLPAAIKSEAQKSTTPAELAQVLEPHAAQPAVAAIIDIVRQAAKGSFDEYVFNSIIAKREPKYLYFDEYYQMLGCENIEALKGRVASGKLKPSDEPLLGLIELAKLNLDQLQSPQRTQDLKNSLEGAGNALTRQIMPYWSQNKHLQMRFDVRTALPGDPDHMRSGTNI